MSRIKVLIVDDSAVVRQLISQYLDEDKDIEVIGTAMDPIFAMEKILRNPPDVITLDVEMPRMDGLSFLAKLMEKYPIPVVMISSLTKKGAETTIKALELGAVDFIAKPETNIHQEFVTLKHEILQKVKLAAQANLKVNRKKGPTPRAPIQSTKVTTTAKGTSGKERKLVVLGASTGGVTAITEVIKSMKPAGYSILVVLHMPAGFTTSFAQRLGGIGEWQASEAQEGELILPDRIYVAPGGKNAILRKTAEGLTISIRPAETSDVFKPNVNKAFASVAQTMGSRAIGVIMTGMGDDGSRGLLLMRQKGAVTVAQNQETCMIYGMPKKAVEIGAVGHIFPLSEIGPRIMQLLGKGER